MRPRFLLLTAAGVLLLGAGVWSLTRPKEETVTASDKRPAAPVVTPATAAAPVPGETALEPGVTAAMGRWGTRELGRVIRAGGAAWLERRGRDPGSLVAMWDLTGDEALLREAAEKHPESPVVCAAMLQHLLRADPPSAEARRWAENFLKATPGNPMGHYHLAALAAREGDSAGAFAAWEKALEQGGRPDSLLRDRLLAVKEGALASGATPGEASMLALTWKMRDMGGDHLRPMAKLVRERFDELKAAGDTEGTQAFAELGYRAVTQLSHTKSSTLVDDLVAASYRRRFLTEMDPSTQLGDTGLTAGETPNEIAALKELVERSRDHNVHTEPEAVLSAYMDRFALDGEAAAMREYLAWKDRQK